MSENEKIVEMWSSAAVSDIQKGKVPLLYWVKREEHLAVLKDKDLIMSQLKARLARAVECARKIRNVYISAGHAVSIQPQIDEICKLVDAIKFDSLCVSAYEEAKEARLLKQAEISVLTAEKTELEARVKELETLHAKSGLVACYEGKVKEVEALKKQLAQVESDNQELKDILNLKDAELETADEKESVLEAKVMGLHDKIKIQAVKIKELENENSRLSGNFGWVDYQNIKKDKESLEARVQELETTNGWKANRIAFLESKLKKAVEAAQRVYQKTKCYCDIDGDKETYFCVKHILGDALKAYSEKENPHA